MIPPASSLAEDDPTLEARWKLLLDFLSTFRQGGGTAKGDSEKEFPTPPPAPPAPADG